jgi:predicted Rossmann fold flavoprotein
MSIDLFPDLTPAALEAQVKQGLEQESRKAVKNILKAWVPERLIPLLMKRAEIGDDLTFHHFPKGMLSHLCELMKSFTFRADGTRSLKEAFVTGGGVHLKEIYPKTMESKLLPGLFFCGEVLDIHGYTGGYNITAAFSTGYTAGMNAAEYRHANV